MYFLICVFLTGCVDRVKDKCVFFDMRFFNGVCREIKRV